MDAERWKRVDELLQDALRVPAEQQQEFLRRECGDDSKTFDPCSLPIARRGVSWNRGAGFSQLPGWQGGTAALLARRGTAWWPGGRQLEAAGATEDDSQAPDVEQSKIRGPEPPRV